MNMCNVKWLWFVPVMLVVAGCNQAPAPSDGSESTDGGETTSSVVVLEETEPIEMAPATADDEAETAEAPAPAPVVEKPEPKKTGIFLEIDEADNFVALLDLQSRYLDGSEQSDAVDEAFDIRWDEIAAEHGAKTLIDGIDFIAAHTTPLSKEKWKYSFLFHVTKDIEEAYHLTVNAEVFGPNRPLLPNDRVEKGFVLHRRVLDDWESTVNWKSGEYQVVEVTSQGNPIPYNLQLNLHSRDENGFVENLVDWLPIGWQWMPNDAREYVEMIYACESPAELYAIAPPGPKVPQKVQDAIDAQWRNFAGKAETRTLTDGLEFVRIDTEVTGANEYTFTYVFKTTADITQDYHLSIVAAVDSSHKQHIDPAKPDGLYERWSLTLYNDPTSAWKADEYHVAQLKQETKIIPYDISINLHTRDDKRNFVESVGETLELGWQADVAE